MMTDALESERVRRVRAEKLVEVQRAEIERLRAGDADLAKTWLARTAKIERLREENERLREENERQQALLRECIPHINDNIGSWESGATRRSEQGQVVAKQKVAEGEELLERIHHVVYFTSRRRQGRSDAQQQLL
jgi:hypothetical protein